MHFGSIRDMSTNSDYRPFIHALTSFDYALSVHAAFDHDVTKLDRQCIKALIKHRNKSKDNHDGNVSETVNIFPEYINETFLAFCMDPTGNMRAQN